MTKFTPKWDVFINSESFCFQIEDHNVQWLTNKASIWSSWFAQKSWGLQVLQSAICCLRAYFHPAVSFHQCSCLHCDARLHHSAQIDHWLNAALGCKSLHCNANNCIRESWRAWCFNSLTFWHLAAHCCIFSVGLRYSLQVSEKVWDNKMRQNYTNESQTIPYKFKVLSNLKTCTIPKVMFFLKQSTLQIQFELSLQKQKQKRRNNRVEANMTVSGLTRRSCLTVGPNFCWGCPMKLQHLFVLVSIYYFAAFEKARSSIGADHGSGLRWPLVHHPPWMPPPWAINQVRTEVKPPVICHPSMKCATPPLCATPMMGHLHKMCCPLPLMHHPPRGAWRWSAKCFAFGAKSLVLHFCWIEVWHCVDRKYFL